MKKLLLVDGNNVMFRAYYATATTGFLMRTSKGVFTNMLYGFINILTKEYPDFTHIAVSFDKGSHTFRHQMSKEYKAQRAKTPDELISQIPLVYKYLDLMNIKHFSLDEFEADDIIGSLSKKFINDFDEIDILSNDNDLFQLIGDNVYQLYTKNKEVIKMDKDKLYEEKKVYPIQIPDYKGLIGDNSDNLKGIEGIGPVTASKLLNEYQTLENIFLHIDEIKGKTKEKLESGKEEGLFTKKMATIIRDVDIDVSVDDLELKNDISIELLDFYKEMEFYSFLNKNKEVIQKEEAPFEYKIIDSPFDLKEILKDNSSLIIEYFGDNYHKSEVLGFGLSNEIGNYFIPFDMVFNSFDLSLYLSDDNIHKNVFNLKAIESILNDNNLSIRGVSFDLLTASYILDSDKGYEDMSLIVQNYDKTVESLEDIYGKGVKKAIPDKEIYSKYAAKKAYILKELKEEVERKIKENNQEYILYQVEMPLSYTLAHMENKGIKVSEKELLEYKESIEEEIKEIEELIYATVGHEFNILSPKQLGDILFNELNLPTNKKTKNGYSTSKEVLESLEGFHPVVSLVLRYRTLTKLHSTYVLGILDSMKMKNDNHIHTIYTQTLTATGRLSSIEPNLQNIPIRYLEGKLLRRVFIPEDNAYLLSCDYSQIELRVLAHMAKESKLIEAFKNGEDIHSSTAKLIFNKNYITEEDRRKAKAVNFGIIYGISAWGLSEDVKISAYEAKNFIENYHKAFPNIKVFMDKCIEEAKENGYVSTLFNRRRYIPDINSSVYMMREFAKRVAMNAPIQGTAADIIKIAMVRLEKELLNGKYKSYIVLQIHDELVLNVYEDELEEVKNLTEKVMKEAFVSEVPLDIHLSYGKNLYDSK